MAHAAAPVLPVSVVVPTIGRDRLLDACLGSLLTCSPAPAEIVVVDQGPDAVVVNCVRRALAERPPVDGCSVRVVANAGRGIARATNAGIRAAAHATVMVT